MIDRGHDVIGSRTRVAIVHQATALSDLRGFKHFDRSFAQTNRLRTAGTDALLAAAREAGVPRFAAQSYASARYRARGGPVKTEDDPLDPTPVPAMRESFAAMRYARRDGRRRGRTRSP